MTDRVAVLFVDDEPHVLNGIRRSMSEMADQWDMAFCESARAALALVHTRSFDVVVSDMRMPQMDGGQLLDAIRQVHPATIRIILSGYADAAAIMRTVGPAHMYMAKPCDAQQLQAAVSRAIALRALLDSPGLRASLAGLTTLPSLPDLFLQVAAELASPNASPKAVAEIIGQDMAMTAEILKLTNSAYFAVGARTSTPLQAVRSLGLETVQALVLRAGIFRQFTGHPELAPALQALTGHSLMVAKLAEDIALAEGGSGAIAKAAYCAGMLSFLGCLVLFDGHGEDYRRALGAVTAERPLHLVEHGVFGANHAVVGAYLLGLWGFADMIVEAVAYACDPAACSGRDNLVLTAVHAARALGPPLPLLPPGVHHLGGPGFAYLWEAGRGGRIEHWQELARQVPAKGE